MNREPRNFDALFLLASIERARGHRAQARALLNRAARLAAQSRGGRARESFWSDSSTALHLTGGLFARAGHSRSRSSCHPDRRRSASAHLRLPARFQRPASQYLEPFFRRASYREPFGLLRRRDSAYGVSLSPDDPRFCGLTLRAGIGLRHFGPGALVNFPQGDGPQRSATTAPIGFAGGSYALNEHVSFDLNWSHLGITYTPLATRLGVVSTRLRGWSECRFRLGHQPPSDLLPGAALQ